LWNFVEREMFSLRIVSGLSDFDPVKRFLGIVDGGAKSCRWSSSVEDADEPGGGEYVSSWSEEEETP